MFAPPGRMLFSNTRPSLPHLLSLRLLGTTASRSTVVKQNVLLSKALTFEDPSAFRAKSWAELIRALGVFRLCSFPVLVNNCGKVSLFVFNDDLKKKKRCNNLTQARSS